MSNVCFVLLNYRSGPYVELLVDSLAGQTRGDWNLIVVDNGSQDDSLGRIVRRLHEKGVHCFEVLCLDENQHFARGMNAGLALAKAELVVPLNSDVYLDPNYVDVLLSAQDRCRGSKVGTFSGIQMVWDWPSLKRTDRVRSHGVAFVRRVGVSSWSPSYESPSQLLGPAGCAPAIRRLALDQVRLPGGDAYDSGFVAFGEDIDLFLRLRLQGFKAVAVPELRYWHVGSASYAEGQLSAASKPAWVMGRAFANRWRIWRRIPSKAERVRDLTPLVTTDVLRYLQIAKRRGARVLREVLRVQWDLVMSLGLEAPYMYSASPEELGLYAGWFSSRSWRAARGPSRTV